MGMIEIIIALALSLQDAPPASALPTDKEADEAVATLNINDTAQLEAGTYRYDVWIEFPGDPPVRQPVVQYAEIHVSDSVTEFPA